MRGVLASAICMAGSLASADSHQFRTSELSVLTAAQTDEPGCVLQIDIINHSTDMHRRMIGVMGIHGVGVGVEMNLNTGPNKGETYSFTPPAGYSARPPSINVVDGAKAVVFVCEDGPYLGF